MAGLKDLAFPVAIFAILAGFFHLALRRSYPLPPAGNKAIIVVSGMCVFG